MITVKKNNFAEAHKELLYQILVHGRAVPTDYDLQGESASLDVTVMIEVSNPWNPAVFSKCMFSDAKGAFDYVNEIVAGSHDHLVQELGYTYHDRLFRQWDGQLAELRRNPYSRRSQSVTWRWEDDLGSEHPPCLQIIHTRIIDNKLEFHTHWRSRDAFKAWGLNIFALAHLQREWARRLCVEPGPYRETIVSCHVYGRDRKVVERQVQRPIKKWYWTLEDMRKEL